MPEELRVGTMYRTTAEIRLVRESDAESGRGNLYEIAFSSEAEVERWFGFEILDHSASSVDLSRMKRGAAVLVDHRGDQVGVVEEARVDDDRKGRAHIRFSRSARGQEVEQDVKDDIRRHISVGYRILKVKKSEDRVIGKDEDGNPITKPVWRAMRWQPMEVSLVSVPADTTVGVGRESNQELEVEVETERASETVAAARTKEKPMPEPVVTEAPLDELKRAQDITAICKNAGMEERAREFIGSILTAQQVAERIQQVIASKPVVVQPPAEEVVAGIPAKDRKRYSYHRAIRNAVLAMEGKGKLDGVEAEMNRELELHWPSGAARKGTLLVPMDLRTDDERLEEMYLQKRTGNTLTATLGPETIFTTAGQLIDMLRNRARVIQMGATVMTGLTGPVGFPKLAAGPAVEWAAENPGAATTASDVLWALVTLSAKTLRGLVGFTRQFLHQSSVDVEGVTRAELAFSHGLAVDRGAIHGTGTGGMPLGIYRTTGVNTEVYAGAATYADLVNQVISIFADNADVSNMGWLTTPEMAGSLAQKFRQASTDTPLWEGNFSNGTVIGYNAMTTNQISKIMLNLVDAGGAQHGVVFGNWSELLIGMFGALDLLLDPYTSADKQIIKIHSFQMCDTALRHPESFAVSTGATP